MKFNVENYLSNLSYINKDFESLWNEILETVPKLTNKWLPSEANESDPLVVLLKELAIFADKLNYNIDLSIMDKAELQKKFEQIYVQKLEPKIIPLEKERKSVAKSSGIFGLSACLLFLASIGA